MKRRFIRTYKGVETDEKVNKIIGLIDKTIHPLDSFEFVDIALVSEKLNGVVARYF